MKLHHTYRAVAVSLLAGALAVTAQPAQAVSASEGFESGATPAGWQTVNLSSPIGDAGWSQGSPDAFPAQAGSPGSYFAANFESGSSTATLSDWLVMPRQTSLSSTDTLEFWTRTLQYDAGNTIYPDRLEVRMSTNGSCSPGTTADGVGDFTTLLTTVNPQLTVDGYPQAWTKYAVSLTGLATTNVAGCIAFRYHVTDGGPSGDNSNFIGLDSVVYTDNASVACTTAQASVTAAQTQVTTATATLTSTSAAASKAAKVVKKATKELKKATKAGNPTKVEKAKKKVKKAKKSLRQAKKRVASAKTVLTAAQTALTTAQTSSTTSCP